MSIPHTLLGLLELRPSHGYTLKHDFDQLIGAGRTLKFGQVYATLARLERQGLVSITAVEAGEGPDRKLYAITPSGVSEFEEWLQSPQPASDHAPKELYARVTLALMGGRSAESILDAQQKVYLERLRELVELRRNGDLIQKIAADYETAHLKADLEWIKVAGQRLDRWAAELNAEGKR